jgi:hypothetical protein
MVEQPASVDEVKAVLGWVIDCDVMPYGGEVGQIYVCEQLNINVGGDNSAGWSDLLTQPGRDGTAPGPDFQASETLANSERCQAPFRHGVKVLLQ